MTQRGPAEHLGVSVEVLDEIACMLFDQNRIRTFSGLSPESRGMVLRLALQAESVALKRLEVRILAEKAGYSRRALDEEEDTPLGQQVSAVLTALEEKSSSF